MENKFLPYPKQFNCGGQRVEVRDVERCDDGAVGEANICAGYIEIAEKFNKSYIQSPDSRKKFVLSRTCALHTLHDGRT
ncbi:hypothetical protein [uncultured Muribaculum sp.]|uniref:hypothetical protein n=1 Tax=uncultured Muribaculum sp. TaxID=1918613 RepID=UPI0027317830|nr:hypothetical protein [uncultured Muribaculum sp.]